MIFVENSVHPEVFLGITGPVDDSFVHACHGSREFSVSRYLDDSIFSVFTRFLSLTSIVR